MIVLGIIFISIISLYALYELIHNRHRSLKEQYRPLLLLGCSVILLLIMTKKFQVLSLLLPGLLPFIKQGLIKVLPYVHASKQQPLHSAPVTGMTVAEAWEILGLEPGASDERIIEQHRKLIQKLHPDRGGSPYLTSRVNQARDLLLKQG